MRNWLKLSERQRRSERTTGIQTEANTDCFGTGRLSYHDNYVATDNRHSCLGTADFHLGESHELFTIHWKSDIVQYAVLDCWNKCRTQIERKVELLHEIV